MELRTYIKEAFIALRKPQFALRSACDFQAGRASGSESVGPHVQLQYRAKRR
jgi:hypothetical protein